MQYCLTLLRVLLFPLAVLYGLIVSIRNLLFDRNILKSTSFNLPIINVGNLSVGGTGKTPQIEYLVNLLQDSYQTAILSRGYKRKSKGFVLANNNSTFLDLGDEPFQYHQKFKKVQVAVDGDRVAGVHNILKKKPTTQVILLDDAYQHRKIKAGFTILLSSYDKLFYNDFIMPTGNLRELWWGKKRADVIVVTKCDRFISKTEMDKIERKIKPKPNQLVLFSSIKYSDSVKGSAEIVLSTFLKQELLLVTGIAKPKPLLAFLESNNAIFTHVEFPDHHHFTRQEIENLKNKAKGLKIVTTEKDYMRLENELDELYYLPIETVFIDNKKQFDTKVLEFVQQY